jgi:hypothetical protein
VEEGALREGLLGEEPQSPRPAPSSRTGVPEGQVGSARVSGRPQGRAGQRGVRWGPRVSPGHPFLGSTSQDPILPATDPDPNLWRLGALCSGETAQPRAVWELEDLIPPQIINTDCRGSGLPGEGPGVGGPRLGEQGCREGKRLRPRPLPDPQGPPGISSISSTPQWSQKLQRGEQALGDVVAGLGRSRAELCPRFRRLWRH